MFSKSGIKPVRMTEEDRQAINRMTKHKCNQFKAAITRGVIGMLNTQAEHKKLDAERQDFLSALTSRNKTKKQQLTAVAGAMKDATSNAPMGIGAASNALLTTASTVGNALLDSAEEKRKDNEAEQRYTSAQFMHYIPTDDYEGIANQVANILSYRFQFLIFRLAGGENGYIKLADFFVESMTAYAILRLRQRKGEYVKALIDAAIPPATNSRRYREWFKFDLDNFRIKFDFAYRKILQLDETANDIIGRSGPAVRALLGGHHYWINPQNGLKEKFGAFTIRGALHHASILNTSGEVLSGLEESPRDAHTLRGDNKYPMLLIANNEKDADIGVNVAPILTSVLLQDAHVITLHRLVPGFFSHQAIYKAEERHIQDVSDIPSSDELKYPEERYEIPWSLERNQRWEERLKTLYETARHASTKQKIVTISNFSELIAMRDAGNEFDAKQAQEDALMALSEASLKYSEAFENIHSPQRERTQLNAAKSAKYLAISARMYLISLVKCDAIKQEDIIFASKLIEFARIALSSSFDSPLLEIKRHRQLKQSSLRISNEARHVNELQLISYKNLQILVQFRERQPSDNSFSSQAYAILFERIKRIKYQLNDSVQELEQLIKLARIITTANPNIQALSRERFEIQLNAFDEKAQEIQSLITSHDETDDIQTIKWKIQNLKTESQHFVSEINLALSHEDYILEEDQLYLYDNEPEELTLGDTILKAKRKAQQTLEAIESHLNQANELINNQTLVQKYFDNSDLKQSLRALLEAVKVNRDQCENLHNKIKLPSISFDAQVSEDINNDEVFLLKRLQAYRRFGMLYQLTMTAKNQEIQTAMSILEERLNNLYRSTIQTATQSVETIFSEISVDQLDKSDVETLRRHTLKAEKIKENGRLEQSINGDMDALNSIFNQDQGVVSSIQNVKQDKSNLNDKIIALLENMSSAVTDLNNIPSPDEQSTKTIHRLLKLYTASNGDTEESKAEDEPEEALHEEGFICQILNKIIVNTTSTSTTWISENAIKEQIGSYLRALKESGSNESVANGDWGVWLIANMIQWTTHKILTQEQYGIEACCDRAQHELRLMKDVLKEEPSHLTNTRRLALQEIKNAYLQIEQNLEEKDRLIAIDCGGDVSESMIISNGLTWAARPNYAEQQWLDARFSSKYKANFFASENHRSPITLLTTLLISFFSNLIEKKKEDIGRLYKLAAHQRQCLKLLFKIKDTTAYKENKIYHLDEKADRVGLMGRIITKKCESIEQEKVDINFTLKSIIGQRLKIYFNEWKGKTHNPETFSELFKAKKQARQEQSAQIKKISHPNLIEKVISRQDCEEKEAPNEIPEKKRFLMFTGHQVSEAVENYTIKEIEDILNELFDDLTKIYQPNKSSSQFPLDSLAEKRGGGSLTLSSPLSKSTTTPSVRTRTRDRTSLNR